MEQESGRFCTDIPILNFSLNMLISFILPCYNVAQYIERAVNSILNQHLDDYEILIIDDGSEDNLMDICKQWCDDTRIKYIRTDNHGVSEARNEGLKLAQGEYVCFLDPDDWYEDGTIAPALQSLIAESADALRFGYNKVYESENLKEGDDAVEDLIRDNYLCEGEAILTELVPAYLGFTLGELKRIFSSDFRKNKRLSFVWSYIFKRQILIDNEIVFARGLHFMEDKLFLCEFLCHAKKVVRYDHVCYNYYVRKDGLRNTNFSDRIIHAQQRVLAERYREEMTERIKSAKNINLAPLYRGTLILATFQMLSYCFRSPSRPLFQLFKDYVHLRSVRNAFKFKSLQ